MDLRELCTINEADRKIQPITRERLHTDSNHPLPTFFFSVLPPHIITAIHHSTYTQSIIELHLLHSQRTTAVVVNKEQKLLSVSQQSIGTTPSLSFFSFPKPFVNMPLTPMSPVHMHNAHQWRQLEVRGESPTVIAAAAAALRSRRASSFEHDYYHDDHSHDHDHELSLSGDTTSLQAAFLTAAEAAMAETIAEAMGDVAGVVRVHESELIPPSPRSGHVAVLEGALPQTDIEPRMWVYGGFSTSTGEQEIFREVCVWRTTGVFFLPLSLSLRFACATFVYMT